MSETPSGHLPVLVEQVLDLLDPHPGQIVLDGTVGQGGHAAALLPRILPGGRYLGLDLDEQMLRVAATRLAGFGADVAVLLQANFADFPARLAQAGLRVVDHMLLDLGVNSAQLDDPLRGFSFYEDGPLDMRYDRQQERRALDLVNGMPEADLADVFWKYGQEGASRKIAKRICQVRHAGRITTTLALARAVESALGVPGQGHVGKTHPATRVFQSLRIYVNDELENLRSFLQNVPQYLAPGGKLAVISFHSLEDGIVKDFIRSEKAAGRFEELTKRPVIAEPPERAANPRSRSAKLRVARRVEG